MGRVRIIGGKWRSRLLNFPDLESLRPTPDRVRETVFNWLAPALAGARCLDLFAGSGALGFEALSRGAHSVVMVDRSSKVITQLKENARLLNAATALEFYCVALPNNKIPVGAVPFNIVFLDPPFHQNLLAPCCEWLINTAALASTALIYIEAESELDTLPVPLDWTVLRSRKAGQVGYHLLQASHHG